MTVLQALTPPARDLLELLGSLKRQWWAAQELADELDRPFGEIAGDLVDLLDLGLVIRASGQVDEGQPSTWRASTFATNELAAGGGGGRG